MHTASRVLLWTVVALVVLVLLGAVALRALDWSALKDEIAARLGDRLGAEVAIRGDLDVGFENGGIRVQAEGVTIEDAFGSPQPLLALAQLRAALELRPLLAGNVVFDHIVLTQPQISLILTEDGEANWDFEALLGEEDRATGPPALPVVRRLEVQGGGVTYRDAAFDRILNAEIGEIQARMSPAGALHASGAAKIESRALRFEARAARIEDGSDWRLAAEATLADARLSLEGTLAEPDVNVVLRVPQPEQLGIPLPGVPVIELAMRVTRDEEQWWLDDLELAAGDQRLNGDVRVDTGQDPPMVYATLHLNELPLPEVEAREREELIPPAPIPTDPLRLVNLRAELSIGRVTNTPVAVNDLELALELEDGRLVARPASVDFAGGELEGSLVFDASRSPPSASTRLVLRGLELAPAVPGAEQPVTGELSGTITLRSRGANVEALAANVNGQLLFVMRGGSLNAAWVEALDLDLGEWFLATAGPGTAKTPIRCALIAFAAEDGVLNAEPVVIDTRDSVITVEGQIGLGTEELKLAVQAFPKDPSVLSAEGPIRISGSLTNPSFDVVSGTTAGQGAAALALGALAGPLAALLPFIETGTAEDQNCRRLLGDQPAAPPAGGKQ